MYFLETKDHVDACIAEAFLENESSFNFLANLKRMPEHSHVPVMLIAVEPGQVARFTSKSMQKAADLLGAYKFVVMPSFDVRQMLREVQSILPEERKPLKDKHPEP